MKPNNRNLSFNWVIAILCGMVIQVSGQTLHYVRAGATGAANGSNWTDAFTSLPNALIRGHVYYIAAGTYNGYTFNDVVSGTTFTTIKKATVADHGTSLGWDDDYGRTATFTNTLFFSTSYWLIDGQTGGGPGNWTNDFGFRICVTNQNSGCGFQTDTGVGYIIGTHFEVQGNGGDGDDGKQDAVLFQTGTSNIVSYAYLHDSGRTLFFSRADNTRFEYVYGGRFESTAGQHAELASIWKGGGVPVTNVTFVNCIWSHLDGTGGIIMDGTGLIVYGNVFYRTPGNSFGAYGNGAIGTWTSSLLSNARILNNSFINIGGAALGFLNSRPSSGNVASNNIFYGCSVSFQNFASHDYNCFVDIQGWQGVPSESNGIRGSGDPFNNYVNMDFTLKRRIVGKPLENKFSIDPLGISRGADGVWDAGAYEYRENRPSAPLNPKVGP